MLHGFGRMGVGRVPARDHGDVNTEAHEFFDTAPSYELCASDHKHARWQLPALAATRSNVHSYAPGFPLHDASPRIPGMANRHLLVWVAAAPGVCRVPYGNTLGLSGAGGSSVTLRNVLYCPLSAGPGMRLGLSQLAAGPAHPHLLVLASLVYRLKFTRSAPPRAHICRVTCIRRVAVSPPAPCARTCPLSACGAAYARKARQTLTALVAH